MFSPFDDEAPLWGQQGRGNPEDQNTMAWVLSTLQTGDTAQNTFQPKTRSDQPSRWAGMDPGDIPFMDHDTTIPMADRFPHNPLGPAVPGPEHIHPATGRFDMDKYMDMVGDRLEVGFGNTEQLAKYQRAGGGVDAGNGVEVAQMQFGYGGATQTSPGRSDGLTRTDPRHLTGNREKDCRNEWRRFIDNEIDYYERNCRRDGTCPDPRKDPSKSYDAYRRNRCGLK